MAAEPKNPKKLMLLAKTKTLQETLVEKSKTQTEDGG